MGYVNAGATVFERNFAPGYLDSPESDTLPSGATPEARNAMFDRVQRGTTTRATMKKRDGNRLLNPVAMGLPNYGVAILSLSPTAFWQFDGTTVTVPDDTGHGHTGTFSTLTGVTTGVRGIAGRGAYALATDHRAVMTCPPVSMFSAGAGTIEFWLRPDTPGPMAATLDMAIAFDSSSYNGLWGRGSDWMLYYVDNPSTYNIMPLTVGALYHVVLAVSSGVGSIYINGVFVMTFPVAATVAFDQFFSYVYGTDNGSMAATLVDELAFYPTALSPSTIAAHYALGMAAGEKVDGLFDFQREGLTDQMLGVSNGQLYLYDGVDFFNPVANGGGWTPGNPTRSLTYKDQMVIADGVQQKRWNGGTLFGMGFAAPTGAPTLTPVSPGGTTIVGTFEGFVTWFDSATLHESSPSPVSNQGVLTGVNDWRRWSKPAGTPPSNVDYWRIYCRRVDTFELNFYLVGTVPIGTATFDEQLLDAARRIAGPRPGENDVPPVFQVWQSWKGYAIGVKGGGNEIYISKQNDFESFNPSDVFEVKSRGKALRGVKLFGTECIIQTPTQCWRLVGDRVPFKIEDLHSSYGSVSQDAGVEVDNFLYDWDADRGPYRTDTNSWTSLGDDRVQNILATINRSSMKDIRVIHDQVNQIVVWAVPNESTNERKRTLLAYSYDLDAWLPPMTGMEYGSFAPFTDPNGTRGSYVGDYWGRVYKLFTGSTDGVPADTTMVASVTSATPGTVTVSGGNFYTGGNGLAGMPVAVLSPTGTWQWRRVQWNTGTTLTLDLTHGVAWTTLPDATYMVIVGGIEFFWWTPWLDFGRPDVKKRGHWLTIQGVATSSGHDLTAVLRFDDQNGVVQGLVFRFPTSTTGAIWGEAVWGEATFGTVAHRMAKQRIGRSFHTVQIRFANFYPNEPVGISAFALGADLLERVRADGVA